jgi:hypothetical protein
LVRRPGPLRRDIGLAERAGLPDDRADVDDPAEAPVEHVLQYGLNHVEGAGEVHAQHGVPVLDGHPANRLVHGDAGVVDQDVHSPVPGEYFLGDPQAVAGLAHVALVH